MEEHKYKRNYGQDLMRLVLAFFIVLMHFNSAFLEPSLAQLFNTLFFIAVPVFFMLSGYNFIGDTQLIKKRLSKTTKIIIWSTFLYSLLFIAAPNSKLATLFSPKMMCDVFVFNNNPFGKQLWYLQAYVYVLLFCLLCTHCPKILQRVVVILSCLLMVVLPLFGKYNILNTELDIYPLRNFFTTGIPYFFLGFVLRKVDIKRLSMVAKVGVPMFLIMSVCEYYFLYSRNSGTFAIGNCYFTTPLLAVSFFIVFSTLNMKQNYVSLWGKNYAIYIYIYHVFFINLSFFFFKRMNALDSINHWMLLLLLIGIIFLTICASVVHVKVFEKK